MTLSPEHKRLQAARATLLLDQPFFGVLALGLQLTEDSTCPTAWTNGQALGFNPAFTAKLSADELSGLIAHEVMHCACGHPWRRDGRDHVRFNVAADHAINHVLQEAGFTLPAGALADAQYAGKWAEWIYDRLPVSQDDSQDSQQQQQRQGSQPGQPSADPGSPGEVRDAPVDATAPTEADWQQQTQQAIKAARGKLPGSLKRSIDELTAPRVDWRSLLRRHLQELSRADYTWTRPNVRYLASGLYLPALHSQDCGRIAIAVDTSGSIDRVLLSQFASELQAIIDELQPSSVDVLYCDTKVNRTDHYDRGEPLQLAAAGGGGTAFEPVFEQLADDPPAVLVYFTDLYGSFPADAPGYPVIWAAYGSRLSAPFGDVVPCT